MTRIPRLMSAAAALVLVTATADAQARAPAPGGVMTGFAAGVAGIPLIIFGDGEGRILGAALTIPVVWTTAAADAAPPAGCSHRRRSRRCRRRRRTHSIGRSRY